MENKMPNYRYVIDSEYFICPKCGGKNIGNFNYDEKYFMCEKCGSESKYLHTVWIKNVCSHCKHSEREYFSYYPNICLYGGNKIKIDGYDYICDNFEEEKK